MKSLLTKAVAYIRVSSIGQLDGDGPERQRTAIARFAEDAGYSVVREFVEDISGTKDTSSRMVFLELLAWCAENGVTHVIIEKSDRISRDMFVGLSIIGDCAAARLRLIDADTQRDLANPRGPYEKFVMQVLMAASELNKNVFVYQSQAAKRRIRERGEKCDGAKGYHDDPNFPLGPTIVARAKQLRDLGHTYRDIADILTRENFPTMNGGQWRGTTVHKMLKRAA